MLKILNGRGGGAILLAILLIATIIISLTSKKKTVEEVKQTQYVAKKSSPLDINDEDAVVASLIAAIECRNEYHRNVQVISVRKVN